MNNTRIRRDNNRDARALAHAYEREDSERGFLARQLLRLLDEAEWNREQQAVFMEERAIDEMLRAVAKGAG